MKRILWSVLFGAMVFAALMIAGCSDDDDAPTRIVTDDNNNMPFEIVSDVYDESGIMEAFTRTMQLTSALIDMEFADKTDGLKKVLATSNDADSIIISAVHSYNYSNGWHIWLCDAIIYVGGAPLIEVSAIDSLQMRIENEPQALPSENIDEFRIIARYTWETQDGSQVASAVHNLRLLKDLLADPNTLTIDAEISENHSVIFTSDSSECAYDALFFEGVDGLEFDLDAEGETVECPNAGGIGIGSLISLECTSEYHPMDTLMIMAEWEFTADVLDDGKIRYMYTDGNFTFITTQECQEESKSAPASLWLWNPICE